MAAAITVVPSGGMPVTLVGTGGIPMTLSRYGGAPVTITTNATPITLVDESGNPMSVFVVPSGGASGVAVPLTGTLTETTLATITVPAGAMGANGIIRVSSVWSYTNSANAKIVRARFGGTAVAAGSYTTTASAPLNFITSNRASQSSQITGLSSGLFSATSNAPNTSAIDTSAATTLTFQGTLANISETITLESYLVEIMYRA